MIALPARLFRLVAVCGAVLICAGGAAQAQITLDPRALDMLGTQPPANEHPAYHLESPKIVPPKAPHVSVPQVSMPQQPAPLPQIPPPIHVPVRPKGAPPPIPINSQAVGRTQPLPQGVRVTFGNDQAMLNFETVKAIRAFGHDMRKTPDRLVAVDGFAVGNPDDPSAARRLSLQRALAVRAVLLDEGIESPRIIVRAMGAASGPGWADRVDVSAGETGAK